MMPPGGVDMNALVDILGVTTRQRRKRSKQLDEGCFRSLAQAKIC